MSLLAATGALATPPLYAVAHGRVWAAIICCAFPGQHHVVLTAVSACCVALLQFL
jgi:hypothetical protein